MIAMAGMFFSGDKTFMSFAIGTMMVVAVAMIGSLTVLPGRCRGSATASTRCASRSSAAGSPTARAGSGARSWAPSSAAARLGDRRRSRARGAGTPGAEAARRQSGFDALPKSMKEVQSLNAVRDAFPGGATPAVVAIKGDVTDPKRNLREDRADLANAQATMTAARQRQEQARAAAAAALLAVVNKEAMAKAAEQQVNAVVAARAAAFKAAKKAALEDKRQYQVMVAYSGALEARILELAAKLAKGRTRRRALATWTAPASASSPRPTACGCTRSCTT